MTFIKKVSQVFSNKLGIIIPFFVFLFLVYGVISEWVGLKQFSWSINPLSIFISLIAYACQLALMFIVWHLIMTRIVGHGNLRVNMNAFFYSSLAKRIPTFVPFLGVRFHVYNKTSQSKPSYVIIGSLLEVFVLIIAGGIFIPILGAITDPTVLLYRYLWIVSVLIFLFVLYPKGFVSFINHIYKKLKLETVSTPINRKILLSLIGISLITYIFNSMAIYFLILGITKQPITIQETVIASSFYYMLTYVTMYLVGGFGIKEIVFGLLMRQSMAFPVGVLIAFIIRLMMIIVEGVAHISASQIYKLERFSEERNIEI